MADLSAHWVDNILPAVPIRQWVLTFPWPLRYRLAWDPDLLADVLGVYLRVLFRWQGCNASIWAWMSSMIAYTSDSAP